MAARGLMSPLCAMKSVSIPSNNRATASSRSGRYQHHHRHLQLHQVIENNTRVINTARRDRLFVGALRIGAGRREVCGRLASAPIDAVVGVDGSGDDEDDVDVIVEGGAVATTTAAAAGVVPVEVDDFDADEYKAVVKLLVTFLEPDWVNPWQTKTAQRSTGSGAVIKRDAKGGGGLILTAAHVVANSTFIQVQLANSPDKVPARVVSVLHEVDLALVAVDEGLDGVEPVPLPEEKEVRLPKLREKVYVLGFPVGGNDLSLSLIHI